MKTIVFFDKQDFHTDNDCYSILNIDNKHNFFCIVIGNEINYLENNVIEVKHTFTTNKEIENISFYYCNDCILAEELDCDILVVTYKDDTETILNPYDLSIIE